MIVFIRVLYQFPPLCSSVEVDSLLFIHLRECCISFSMTSYKRCDRLLNCEADFIKYFYPIYYNVIPYLLGLNVGKTKKANSGLNFPKLMAR